MTNIENTHRRPLAASHGEVQIIANKIPANAKRFFPRGPLVLADSETTGNHHLLDVGDDCELYRFNDACYMRNKSAATVRCAMAGRHDAIVIPPGEWVFSRAKAWDYLSRVSRDVTD